MGLGGHLMWTPVIKELKKRCPNRKIVLVKSKGRRFSEVDLLRKNSLMEDIKSEIFLNNPNLTKLVDVGIKDDVLYMDLVLRNNSYYAEVCDKQVKFNNNSKHIIEGFGRSYQIEELEKKCELFLTEREKQKVKKVTENLGSFITIEPHAKLDFTPNKCWEGKKWQDVVDVLSKDYSIVQISAKGKSVLRGVEDLTGILSFREACGVIGESSLFVSTEGGLVHAANAVGVKTVVIYTGWQPMNLTAYEDNINLYPDIDCAPCGLLIKCPINIKCNDCISTVDVVDAVKNAFRKKT